jgi:TolB protein
MQITTLLLAAAVALPLGPPRRVTNVKDAYPMLSPDGSRLLFESDRTGNWEIYTMRPDGTDLVRLTSAPAPDVGPIWSPDGKRIVFASERDAGDSEIYVMNADGSGQRRLTRQPGDDSHPHWSPDGARIVFNSARTTPDLSADWSKQHLEIFTMAADGSDVRQITRFKTVSTYPQFSPDGKKIAFRRVTDEPGMLWDLTLGARNSEVFVINADGSNPVNVSKSAAYDGWPAWSPDGARIVFSSNRAGPANIGQLYSVDAEGGNLTKLTDGPGSFVQPSWSRDGKRIYAFQHWETEEFGNIAVFEVGPR